MRVNVRGRVQGVGFRFYVRDCARRYRLVGWVRNLPDGTVELVAEGAANALESLVHDVEAGPRRGLVDNCVVSKLAATGNFDRFEIDYGP